MIDIENDLGLDDLEYVSRDNYREIRSNKNCYIYTKPVLERTIELCEENNLNYKINNCGDYYVIEGNGNVKGRRKKV